MPSQLIPPSKSKMLGGLVLSPGGGLGGGLGTGGGDEGKIGNTSSGGAYRGTFSSKSFSGGSSVGTFSSKSLSAGGFRGTFTSKSASGGGMANNIPLSIRTVQPGGGGSILHSTFGFWLKANGRPANPTTLFDFDVGPTGYWRTYLSATGRIITECIFNGNYQSVDCYGSEIPYGGHLWVSITHGQWGSGIDNTLRLAGIVYIPGGSTPGTQAYGLQVACTINTDLTTRFGLGVSLSSGYANFPNSPGLWELTKFQYDTISAGGQNLPVQGPPVADVGAGGILRYMCRQTVGAAATLNDTSGNAYNLSAGPNGLYINDDGPYGS